MHVFSIIGPLLPLVVVVIAVTIAIEFFKAKKGNFGEEKPKYNYQKKQFFMTRAENAFYQGLVKAVGNEYAIFAQVSLPTVVDEKIRGQDWRAARAHINRKSVDYVLCDKVYLNPKLAIELDDSFHDLEHRKERDAEVERILAQAGLKLLRVRYAENIDVPELTKRIKELV
jgi:very-short-patch-repair endonuclease